MEAGKGGKAPAMYRKLRAQYQLLIMSVPFMAVLVLFNYVPLWGWVMAFQDYSLSRGITGSPFVGFDHFVDLFGDDRFYLVLRNTLVMSVLSLVTGFVGAIGLALLLNEVRLRFFKRTVQTITYIPHFVSWVVMANIVLGVLSPDGGIINEVLMRLGFIDEPIMFMSKGSWFWVIHTLVGLWKELGWSTIIYLAVIAGLNPELYEAAEVDGAGRIQKMWHISVPGLMPTAVLLLILATGNLVNTGYESQFLLGNGQNIDYSQVLDLYALDYSFSIGDYSYGVAISVFKSAVSILLVFGVNQAARRLGDFKAF
jgi:putative aldouronate transport system permease protein